jgi:hypothetical protein
MAPSAVRPAEIREAVQDNGVVMSFASIRHALGQLERHAAAEQIGDSKTWRYPGVQPERTAAASRLAPSMVAQTASEGHGSFESTSTTCTFIDIVRLR